ncbi:MAG: threonine aldolase, partial [Bdellovibrionales bacterium]|nr:threonine aldolase [Bdellovibrionales bacterium]
MAHSFLPSFGSDNHSGVHPKILQSLTEVNLSHAPSYGTDDVTKNTNKTFQNLFGQDCHSFFVFNGTAANVLASKALIPSYKSVICTDVSH